MRQIARWYRLAWCRWASICLDAAATLPAFFNPRWLRHIISVARQTRAEVVLCRDLPLAVPSILVAKRLDIPVILDMAENYPAMLESRRLRGRSKRRDWIERNPAPARLIEERALPRAHGV